MKKNKSNRIAALITVLVFLIPILYLFKDHLELPSIDFAKKESVKKEKKIVSGDGNVGKVIDRFNGVNVYYNGRVRNVNGRNTTKDGYNLGLKYQCVEFVKRYYYERFNHKMPDSYGHAKDFFNTSLEDGAFNSKRGLYQFSNASKFKPKKEDILVYGPATFNQFGHIAIITKVTSNTVECISQNLGKGNGTRRTYNLLKNESGGYLIDEPYIKGWLSRNI